MRDFVMLTIVLAMALAVFAGAAMGQESAGQAYVFVAPGLLRSNGAIRWLAAHGRRR